MKITIALAQIDIGLGRVEENLTKAKEMVSRAREEGAQVILFPELWSTGYDLGRMEEHAMATEGLLLRLSQLAEERLIYIIGSLITKKGENYFNTATIFSSEGQMVGEYDKGHLFPPLEEDRHFSPGWSTPLFDLPWGKTALAICYDLRFPELFRRYTLAGAKIVFLPSEWPYPRLEHWRVLLRARAIEDQIFLVACNRVGEAKGYRFVGHSAICDPRGERVIEGGEEEALLVATIDLDLVEEVRCQLPFLGDRREDLY